jgi:hypothetical protein
MAKTYQAPLFVRVANILTTTLLRAGVKLVGYGHYPMYLKGGNPFARSYGVTAGSSLEEFERAVLTHPVFVLERK